MYCCLKRILGGAFYFVSTAHPLVIVNIFVITVFIINNNQFISSRLTNPALSFLLDFTVVPGEVWGGEGTKSV